MDPSKHSPSHLDYPFTNTSLKRPAASESDSEVEHTRGGFKVPALQQATAPSATDIQEKENDKYQIDDGTNTFGSDQLLGKRKRVDFSKEEESAGKAEEAVEGGKELGPDHGSSRKGKKRAAPPPEGSPSGSTTLEGGERERKRPYSKDGGAEAQSSTRSFVLEDSKKSRQQRKTAEAFDAALDFSRSGLVGGSTSLAVVGALSSAAFEGSSVAAARNLASLSSEAKATKNYFAPAALATSPVGLSSPSASSAASATTPGVFSYTAPPYHPCSATTATNYSPYPTYSAPTPSINAMLDLDESLRALYFAPFPLLVLDHTRCIRMINKSAETILGTSGPIALGMLFEKFIAPASQMSFLASMNDAVSRSTQLKHDFSDIDTFPRDRMKRRGLDVCCQDPRRRESAWQILNPPHSYRSKCR